MSCFKKKKHITSSYESLHVFGTKSFSDLFSSCIHYFVENSNNDEMKKTEKTILSYLVINDNYFFSCLTFVCTF